MSKINSRYLLLIPILLMLPFSISCSDSSSDANDSNPLDIPWGGEEVVKDKEWVLVWSDEFDADSLDMSHWSYQIGTGAEAGLTGWGNNELQYYTDRQENVYIEDGMLHIVARKESYEGMRYTSGRIRSLGKGDWMYGRIEIRAKNPEGQGIWPAIWMLPSSQGSTWPRHGEIDIMELVGHEPSTVHSTVHFGGDWPQHEFEGESYSISEGTFADDFYIYSIEWKLNEIKFHVNGDHFFTVTPATVSQYNFVYPFNSTFHLLMNVAVGGNWPRSPDSTTQFPQSMIVDYVRVYQLQ